MPLPMTRADAEYCYRELSEILNRTFTPRILFLSLRTTFTDILAAITAAELQFFSSGFARWKYVCDRYHVPADLAADADALRRFETGLRAHRTECEMPQVEAGIFILGRLIWFFSEVEMPSEIARCMSAPPLTGFRSDTADTLPLLRAVVTGKPYPVEQPFPAIMLPVAVEDEGSILIALRGIATEIASYVWQGATVHLTDVRRSKRDTGLFSTTAATLAVLEPDILFDVTAVAECFQNLGANHRLYFLQRFKASGATGAMLLGSIVNGCFDALLDNPDADFDVLFTTALRQKPLVSFAGLGDAPDAVETLRTAVRAHFDALREIVPSLEADSYAVEPSFISPRYGLQGRLDLLMEYTAEPSRKTVVELKSGSAPKPDAASRLYEDQQPLPLGMWANHYAQITCYNLLLDSAYPGRTGDSSVLYSADRVRPLRNAPNIIPAKAAVLNVRNRIVAAEYGLINRKFGLFDDFRPEKFGAVPSFVREELLDFSIIYKALSPTEKLYYQAFTSFLLREQYAARTGNETGERSGFAALWRDSLDEKRARMTALADLVLLPEESDFIQLHLTFAREPIATPFRAGDIILLYPMVTDGAANPVERQIIKATIRELTTDKVRVSVRNKLLGDNFFSPQDTGERWIIEADYMDAGFDHLHRALGATLRADQQKRSVLLGLTAPRFEEDYKLPATIHAPSDGYYRDVVLEGVSTAASLHSEQLRLVEQALAARDYFLLQGPPGTGKTSVMLKSIVEILYRTTDETVLLVAFTNRAVDEICASLIRIEPDFPFIRIGSKEQTGFEEQMLWKIAESSDISALADRLRQTRFFVATVAATLANPELFSIKKFTTLIADEASQLIEPHLAGLFVQVGRCIFIGDEKQLPAVVVQDERGATVAHPALMDIELNDLRMSLFERLLRCCKANGWTQGFGMLERQARMHVDIQDAVNSRFYGGALRPMNEWQTDSRTAFSDEHTLIGRITSVGRVVFIPSPRETGIKIHAIEAHRASAIAASIAVASGEDFTSRTAGIITPFRAQIAEITRALPFELRELITVDTVERYQGSERDIIIISLSVNFPAQLKAIQSLVELDGLLIDRKLNVAITRARKQIIILGCEEVLRESAVYSSLLDECIKWEWEE